MAAMEKTGIIAKIKELKTYEIAKIFIIFFFLIILGFLAFQYLFQTNFPIGHDAGHHATNAIRIQESGFSLNSFSKIAYPLPLAIYSFVQAITGLEWPFLFIIVICSFLFLGSIALLCFAKSVTKSWAIGIAAAILFVTSKWTGDALRIGFLAEIWAWLIFLIASYFLINKKFWPLVISFLILLISHPLVAAVFVLISIIYSIAIWFFSKDKEYKKMLLKFWAVFTLITAVIALLFTNKLDFFLHYAENSYLEGARDFRQIIFSDNKARSLIYFMALFGLGISFKKIKNNGILFFWVMLLVSALMIQSYLWGINFMVFRFYPYFEIAIAFFAGYAISFLVNNIFQNFKNNYWNLISIIMIIIVTLVLAWPNIKTNKEITSWQLNDQKILATMPVQDREVLKWAKNNLPKDSKFIAQVKWGAWVKPIAGFPTMESDKLLSQKGHWSTYTLLRQYRIKYIYLSSFRKRTIIDAYPQFFTKIYEKENARIYKVNKSWRI